MHLLVCYDVVSNRRRNKLHRRMKGLLEPVQKSVFEGLLPTQRYGELTAAIHECIDHNVDTVRIYALCRSCTGLIDLFGVASPVTDPDDDFVF